MNTKVSEQSLTRRFLILTVAIILSLNLITAYGQDISTLKESSEERYHTLTIFYLMAGIPFGQSAGDFFTTYALRLGGRNNQFITNPMVGLGLKFHFWEEFRLGVGVSYTSTNFRDSFTHQVKEPYQVDFEVSEELDIDMYPVIFTLEYIPYYRKQFKSYAGLGAGLGISSFVWNERVSSNDLSSKRRSGLKYEEWIFSPAARFVSGVELGFDKDPGEYLIGSLILELRYTYTYKQMDIFKNIRNEVRTITEDLERKYNIIPGYFSVNVALSFNLK